MRLFQSQVDGDLPQRDGARSSGSAKAFVQDAPLLCLPSELLEVICAQLALPLQGLYLSHLHKRKRAELRGRWKDLANLSATCCVLRQLASPHLFRLIELPSDDGRRRAGLLRLLALPHARRHIQSLIVGVPPLTDGDGGSDSDENVVDAFDNDSGSAVDGILDTALPVLRRVHFHRHRCQASTYSALASSQTLETLLLDDDFLLTDEAADSVAYEFDQKASVPSSCYALRQLQISTPPNYILARQRDVLEPMIALAARSKVLEYLCLRTYSSTLGSNLIPSSLWASLRTLALDAGDEPTSGFVDLFEGFRVHCVFQYRSRALRCIQIYRASHLSDTVPLDTLILESRRSSLQLFNHIIACLSGHTTLRNLSLCVIPSVAVDFFYDVQRALPYLKELHILAFSGAQLIWPNAGLEEWARGLSTFKHLHTFGWNDPRVIGLGRLCPAPMRYFVGYDSYGTTHYRGSRWTRLEDSEVFARNHRDVATFFPVLPPALEKQR